MAQLSKKMRPVVVTVIILAALIGFFLFLTKKKPSKKSKTAPQTIVGENVTLYQYFQNKKPASVILISVPMTKNLKKPLSFSVYLDMDADDKFTEKELAVDNFPAPVEKLLPNVFPLRFADSKLAKKLIDLPNDAKVTAKIVVGDEKKQVKTKKVPVEIGEFFNPAPGFSGNTLVVSAADEAKIPVSNDGVPDLNGRKGKPNECVPISIANSLLWLAKKHKFADKLPADDDDLIDELAKDLKWTKDGVKNENVLTGKEAFNKRRELPLDNKKIDNEVIEGESQLWKRIVEELNRGEDVELLLDFKQSPKGKAEKGHAVTVVGADKNKKGKKFLTFHDPATKEGNDTYEVDRNGQILGYPLGKTYVNFIISESFIKITPTPSAKPTPTPTPSPTSSPTNTQAPTSAPASTSTPTPGSTNSPTPNLSPAPTTSLTPTNTPTGTPEATVSST